GIGLLPRATARTPDAQSPFGSLPDANQFRKDLLGQDIQAAFLPEKISLSDGQFTGQNFELLFGQWSREQPLGARFGIRQAKLPGRRPDPSLQVTPALARKVQAQQIGDKFAEL